jgi:hypothetical protein
MDFTHDDDSRGTVTVSGREVSPAELWNSHNSKIVVADHIERCQVFVPAFGLTLRMNIDQYGYAEHRQSTGCGNGANARQRRHALPNPCIENGAGGAAAIGRRRQSQEIRQHVVRIVAEIGRAYGGERSDQQPRAHQQDKGESYFTADQYSL